MRPELVHRLNGQVNLLYNGVDLFEYHYRPAVDPKEVSKPYFHPIRTLKGHVMTNYRPTDHRWHTGLSMTFADLSGQNFWGGPTYVRDEGYKWLPNYGRQHHVEWQQMAVGDDGARLTEILQWVTFDGSCWLEEQRGIEVGAIHPGDDCWTLTLCSRLTNVSGETLAFGSPTTNGRPSAGYGSLFWRGPRSFTGATVKASGGSVEEERMMGQRSPWLAFVGEHDETDDDTTIIFIDDPGNVRYPNQWFVRSTPYACASFAFMFDSVYELLPDATLQLTYHVVVADGKWDHGRIERTVAERLQVGGHFE